MTIGKLKQLIRNYKDNEEIFVGLPKERGVRILVDFKLAKSKSLYDWIIEPENY